MGSWDDSKTMQSRQRSSRRRLGGMLACHEWISTSKPQITVEKTCQHMPTMSRDCPKKHGSLDIGSPFLAFHRSFRAVLCERLEFQHPLVWNLGGCRLDCQGTAEMCKLQHPEASKKLLGWICIYIYVYMSIDCSDIFFHTNGTSLLWIFYRLDLRSPTWDWLKTGSSPWVWVSITPCRRTELVGASQAFR